MSLRNIALELHFLRLSTVWTRRKERIFDQRGEESVGYFYVPGVDCDAAPELIEDPRKLRNEFLRMERSEEAALRFLRLVGVWDVDEREPQSDLPETRLSGTFGFRVVTGAARSVALDDIWAAQEYWKDLLKGPAKRRDEKLRAKFGPPPHADARPHDHITFAWNTHFFNTLPMHLEWKRNPHAVIQPVTARELLIAATWVDLVSGSQFQECEHCGTPFTWDRKRTFCPPYKLTGISPCAHVVAQREYKKREDAKKRQAERLSKKDARKSLR